MLSSSYERIVLDISNESLDYRELDLLSLVASLGASSSPVYQRA
jgi:hypothetical protein